MTTVIDIGCARYGGDYSIERLIDEFRPDILYGFDPTFDHRMYTERRSATQVVIGKQVAWIYDGEIGFLEDGLNSCLTDRTDVPMVPCFDLAAFIIGLEDTDLILKIDAEGSEYQLLDHLIEHRADALLRLAWVEWHPAKMDPLGERRASIERRIACELQEWNW